VVFPEIIFQVPTSGLFFCATQNVVNKNNRMVIEVLSCIVFNLKWLDITKF